MHVYFGQWRVSRSLLGWSCVHTTDARHCFFVINRVKTLVWGTLNSQTNIVTTCTWFLKMFYHTVYIKSLGLFFCIVICLPLNFVFATYIFLLAMLYHFLTQRDAFFLFYKRGCKFEQDIGILRQSKVQSWNPEKPWSINQQRTCIYSIIL